VNKQKFVGIMYENGDNQGKLAEAMDISLSRLNAKINGSGEFSQSEIQFIKDRYDLDADKVDEIFFTPPVS
jgi:hypothetical protein